MTNPLSSLPPKVRLYVYLILGVIALGIAAWQAADGDWLKAAGLLLGSLGFGTAVSNVDTSEPWHEEDDHEPLPPPLPPVVEH